MPPTIKWVARLPGFDPRYKYARATFASRFPYVAKASGDQVELLFGGDCELEVLKDALRFVLRALETTEQIAAQNVVGSHCHPELRFR